MARSLCAFADSNLLLAPLRRDALDLTKESGAWARLGIQYSLIVNAGALAALPYLLAQGSAYRIDVSDASAAACIFAAGLFSAAVCCLFAYLNLQIMAEAYWADWDAEMKNMVDRHFEHEQFRKEVPLDVARAKRIRKHVAWTVKVGVVLGVGSWVAFIAGALLLILFRTAPHLI
jgi:hypothetical protein